MNIMTQYKDIPTQSAEPQASSMIETFRAIGYNIDTAIADIIDNSISADAKNIWIQFDWKGSSSCISIKDDGFGMNSEGIVQAMRPGSRNPLDERSAKDLGRFGLGLKTASFSQCRSLTVVSKKKDYKACFWTWDLDYVAQTQKWDLLQYIKEYRFVAELDKQVSGTTVIWENIDRLVGKMQEDNDGDKNRFFDIAITVKKHIGMVFHRFIAQGKIKIYFNDNIVEAWNPFMSDKSQVLSDEPLYDGQINVKPYILPHISRINKETYTVGEGIKGWVAHQGFYIYRNERLLVAGSWLGMFKKEEHYKLARIMIDIPNHLDDEWQIDIKKSSARPPLAVREELRRIAKATRVKAVEIYRHRGKIINPRTEQDVIPLWQEKVKHDKRFFKINREHPIVKYVMESEENNKLYIKSLLRLIEETIPTPTIALRQSEKPNEQANPFDGAETDEIVGFMKLHYNILLETLHSDSAKKQLLLIEPFNLYPDLVNGIDKL
jgi:Histidine kinase-, DNA gyrase B-, and HSP90-like ATPase